MLTSGAKYFADVWWRTAFIRAGSYVKTKPYTRQLELLFPAQFSQRENSVVFTYSLFSLTFIKSVQAQCKPGIWATANTRGCVWAGNLKYGDMIERNIWFWLGGMQTLTETIFDQRSSDFIIYYYLLLFWTWWTLAFWWALRNRFIIGDDVQQKREIIHINCDQNPL